ncbi:hypothetical protein [Nocardia bovistercoris]|uniref:Uncharacterized protein n=1 Tax=Nocardia bovistercoris TaxID=2785916 RepID=A0A931IF64_9NOCA|nr:hypothetical protein [Nocardia bovistercoris]MBH0779428.1 hypothetical protein [Nocardia bovistercoris]
MAVYNGVDTDHFERRRRAVMYGHGATREIDVPGEKYRFYYSGIRLFHQTADAYYLIPTQWKPGRERVLVIPRTDGIRIDLDARHGR